MFIGKIKAICAALAVLTLVTACGGGDSESNPTTDLSADAQNAPTGRFVQTDCTPPSISNARPLCLSQRASGEILLSVFDPARNSLRAFSSANGAWSERDNQAVQAFMAANKVNKISGVCDYSNNWWVDYTTDAGELKVCKISRDGASQEVKIPYVNEAKEKGEEIYITSRQLGESGKLCMTIANVTNQVRFVILDGTTGEVIQTIQPDAADYAPAFDGDTLYALDLPNRKINEYDTSTGNILSSRSIPLRESPACYTMNGKSQIVYADTKGIHKIIPDGNLVQTVIDNPQYAYADPSVSEIYGVLTDNNSGNYLLACKQNEALKIYQYSLDTELPTNPTDKLYVWAYEDNSAIRAAASVFAQKNPECEVVFEFGQAGESTGLTHDDVVRNLNTRLLAGNTPDVLFLDGLSYDTLLRKGLLSAIDLQLNREDFYENILTSYSENDKIYAYPAFFRFPVFACEGGPDAVGQNTVENIAKLYRDEKQIYNNSYRDIFETFYCAEYSSLFPADKTVNEEKLKEFLNGTKEMTSNQNITSETSPWGDLGLSGPGGTTMETVAFKPSLMRFSSNDAQYAAGIVENMAAAATLFKHNAPVELVPLLDGDYLGRCIASIPTNAKNKALAGDFIGILLNSDAVQQNNVAGGFAVKRNVELQKLRDAQSNGGQAFLEIAEGYDWGCLIAGLHKPIDGDETLRDMIYSQAKRLYAGEIDVDTAFSEIMKTLNLFLAERH